MIELDSLSYWYPGQTSAALDDLTWNCDGGMALIVGDSGSGKSTLLRAISGLVPHFFGGRIRGHIKVADHNVLRTAARDMARQVGSVFQDPETQCVATTVAADVAFGPCNIGLPAAQIAALVATTLARVGLDGFQSRRISDLSGGERQRVAIAGALALQPSILLLDEPLSQLDDRAAAEVVRVLTDLAQLGTTVVVAEQRHELLPDASTRLHMRAGSIDRRRIPAIPPARGLTAPAPGAVAWKIESATLRLGTRTVLSGFDMAGCRGEIVALHGANGSGKTTLLRALAGLIPLAAGRTWHQGPIGYLPQNPSALLHQETVATEIGLGLSNDAANHWMAVFKLTDLADRYPPRPQLRAAPTRRHCRSAGRRNAADPARRTDPRHRRHLP